MMLSMNNFICIQGSIDYVVIIQHIDSLNLELVDIGKIKSLNYYKYIHNQQFFHFRQFSSILIHFFQILTCILQRTILGFYQLHFILFFTHTKAKLVFVHSLKIGKNTQNKKTCYELKYQIFTGSVFKQLHYKFQIINFREEQIMGKKEIGKKFKTPATMRFRLLQMVLLENYTNKYAAQKLGIKYSTAKAIIKENQDSFFQSNLPPKIYPEKGKIIEAGYRIIQEPITQPKVESAGQKSHETLNSSSNRPYKPIKIISRVEWTFDIDGKIQKMRHI